MITEDYVSFETAKLLKEKGFEYNPDESYWLIDADNKMYWVSRIGAYDYVDVPTESFQRPKNGYRLITQAMAMKWLREEQQISVEALPDWFDSNHTDIHDGWYCEIRYLTNMSYDAGYFEHKKYDSYKKAVEAAIKYCLENLI